MYEENVDYQLIPSSESEQAWWVRILTGDYVEVVIAYDKVTIDGEAGELHYSFELIYTPDDSLSNEDEEFQKVVSSLLQTIILSSMEKKTVQFSDKVTGEMIDY